MQFGLKNVECRCNIWAWPKKGSPPPSPPPVFPAAPPPPAPDPMLSCLLMQYLGLVRKG